MSRLHPFDFVFAATAEAWFAAIHAAGATAGRDLGDRLQFQQLAEVRTILEELQPPDPDRPGAIVEEYGSLLWSAYRYWSAGRHTLPLSPDGLTHALATEPVGLPHVPHGACYLQLPERAFWASIANSTPPEPLDGLFVATGVAEREVTVLAVLGLRPQREGFSQIAISAPPEDLVRAGESVRRPLFAPVLEGAERAGMRSLVSEAELLYLTCLALAEVAR